MSWTLCTSGAAIAKAGRYANSTIIASGSALADWSDEAESFICDISHVDVVTSYSSLTANGKKLLQEIASSLVAEKIVAYDIYSYISKGEATMILNVLENNIKRGLDLIKDDKIKTYLAAT